MSRSPIRVLLELDTGIEPIAGTLRQPPNSDPKPFTAWLQLTQMLEAIRNSKADTQLEAKVK